MALTLQELIRQFSGGNSKAVSDVPVEQAVRELASGGLLHRLSEEELLLPTWAAALYFELSGGRVEMSNRDPNQALVDALRNPLWWRLLRRYVESSETTSLIDEVPWGRAALGLGGDPE
jgi:hypothetical protein